MLKRGFTLVEFLVVVLVIAILAAVMMPIFHEIQIENKDKSFRLKIGGIRVTSNGKKEVKLLIPSDKWKWEGNDQKHIYLHFVEAEWTLLPIPPDYVKVRIFDKKLPKGFRDVEFNCNNPVNIDKFRLGAGKREVWCWRQQGKRKVLCFHKVLFISEKR